MLNSARAGGLAGGFQLLPFLDIVFAMVGIFLVVFVLQSLYEEPRAGLAGVDELIVCEGGRALRLYSAPDADPVEIPAARVREIFQYLPERQRVSNLSFALGADCFAARRGFERAFEEFSGRLQREGAATRRLNFRPLGSHPDAVTALLARWRRERGAP